MGSRVKIINKLISTHFTITTNSSKYVSIIILSWKLHFFNPSVGGSNTGMVFRGCDLIKCSDTFESPNIVLWSIINFSFKCRVGVVNLTYVVYFLIQWVFSNAAVSGRKHVMTNSVVMDIFSMHSAFLSLRNHYIPMQNKTLYVQWAGTIILNIY